MATSPAKKYSCTPSPALCRELTAQGYKLQEVTTASPGTFPEEFKIKTGGFEREQDRTWKNPEYSVYAQGLIWGQSVQRFENLTVENDWEFKTQVSQREHSAWRGAGLRRAKSTLERDPLAGNATVALGRWTVHPRACPLACLPRGWKPPRGARHLCGPGETFAAPGSEPREEGDAAPDVQLIPKIFPMGQKARPTGWVLGEKPGGRAA